MRAMVLLVPVLAAGVLAGTPGSAARAELGRDPVPAGQGAWPLSPPPTVVRRFDPPAVRWAAGHRGVDLLGRPGQPVRAGLAGRVTFASSLAGRGVVVVSHGAVRTTYEPVTASVRRGDAVARGSVVGTLQPRSSHCFPRACLHWGMIRDRSYLDPLLLVGLAPIRLLPLAGAAAVGTADDAGWGVPRWPSALGVASPSRSAAPAARVPWTGAAQPR